MNTSVVKALREWDYWLTRGLSDEVGSVELDRKVLEARRNLVRVLRETSSSEPLRVAA